MARPTKYTPQRVEAILKALRAGNTETNAAAYAEIHYDTCWMWKRHKPKFAEAIEKAQADAQALMVERVVDAAKTNWTAAAWWLERRYPQEWGKVERLEITLKDQIAAVAEELALSPEAAAALHADVAQYLQAARRQR
jgi:hypothetical protein